ncbi:MAG: T9SS type A sorting domain-containing protein, partial [Sphingobacteriales bacterium]
LVLGGAFTYQNEMKNVIRWNADDNFVNYASGIANEVMDFQLFQDTLYAACKQTVPSQLSPTLYKLSGDSWVNGIIEELTFTNDGPISFNTLSVCNDRLMIGGDFKYNAMMGIYGDNLASMSGFSMSGEWMVDSTINTSVKFKGSYYAGGAFRNGGMMGNEVVLNGIAKKHGTTTGIQTPEFNADVTLSPNPVAGGRIAITNRFAAQQLTMTDISGRLIGVQKMDNKLQQQNVTLPEAAPGLYLLRLSNDKGQQVTKKIVVK